MRKKLKKALCIFLVTVTVMQILPMSVFAQEVRENNNQNNIEDIETVNTQNESGISDFTDQYFDFQESGSDNGLFLDSQSNDYSDSPISIPWVKSVTLTAETDLSAEQLPEAPYSFSTAEEEYDWQSEPQKTVTRNGMYYIYLQDVSGNITLLNTVTITNIDRNAPTVTNISCYDNGNTTVITVTAEDSASGVAGYSIDNGETWQESNVFTFNKDTYNYLKISTKDNVGNISTRYYNFYYPKLYYENNRIGIYNPNPNCDCKIYYTFKNTPASLTDRKKYIKPVAAPENADKITVAFSGPSSGFTQTKYQYDIEIPYDNQFSYREAATDISLKYDDIAFDISRYYADSDWQYSFDSYIVISEDKALIEAYMPDFNRYCFVAKDKYNFVNEINGYKLSVKCDDNGNPNEYVINYNDVNYHYGNDGKLSKISNAYKNIFTFTRTQNAITITDGAGRSVSVNLNNGNISSVTDTVGGQISYTYDNNNLIKVTDQAGVIIGEYGYTNGELTKTGKNSIIRDEQDRITKILQDNGYYVLYQYNDNDNQVVLTTADGTVNAVTYNHFGNIASTSDENENTTEYIYDDCGYLTKIVNSDESFTEYWYTDDYKLSYEGAYEKNSEGIYSATSYSSYSYDDDGRLSCYNDSSEGNIYICYDYNDKGVMSVKARYNRETSYSRDYVPTSYIPGYTYESVLNYTYDENGKLIKIEDTVTNEVTLYTYDENGNIKKVSSCDNSGEEPVITETVYNYGSNNNLLSVKSNGENTYFSYDAAGRTLLTHSGDEYMRTVYDNYGRTVQELDSDDYDAELDNLPFAYTDTSAGHTYEYNSAGSLVKEKNKYGTVTTYAYSDIGSISEKHFDIYDYYYTKDGKYDKILVNGNIVEEHLYSTLEEEGTFGEKYIELITYANAQQEEITSSESGVIVAKKNTKNGVSNSYFGLFPFPSYDGNYINIDSDTRTLVKKTAASEEVLKLESFNSGLTELYKYVITHNEDTGATTVDESLFNTTSVNTVYSDNTTAITIGDNTVQYSYDEETDSETLQYNSNEVYSVQFSYDKENNKSIKSYPSLNYSLFVKYDNEGNIISDDSAVGENNAYSYNDNGELISVNGNHTGQYTYDNRGNMLTQTVGYNGNVYRNDVYTYNTSGWKDQLIAVNETPLTYDGVGNLISYGNKQFTWTYGKTLESVIDGENTYSYTYDETGIRTKKIINGETTYINSRDGVVYSQKNSTDSMYFQYNNSGEPIGFILNNEQFFYLTNMYGDITAILDAQGNEVAEYVYTAWGELLEIEPSEPGNTEQYAIAEKNPLRYRGYYYDSETGMYYLQSRYYDPQLCRFISADSYDYINTEDYNGTNAYAYCCNDPINCIDFNGNSSVSTDTRNKMIVRYKNYLSALGYATVYTNSENNTYTVTRDSDGVYSLTGEHRFNSGKKYYNSVFIYGTTDAWKNAYQSLCRARENAKGLIDACIELMGCGVIIAFVVLIIGILIWGIKNEVLDSEIQLARNRIDKSKNAGYYEFMQVLSVTVLKNGKQSTQTLVTES